MLTSQIDNLLVTKTVDLGLCEGEDGSGEYHGSGKVQDN
jgi:hypothetical protein